MILHPDKDRYPKDNLNSGLEMILCFLPSSAVSCLVGVYLSTHSFNRLRVKYKKISFTNLGLSYYEPLTLTGLWSMIDLVNEVLSVSLL